MDDNEPLAADALGAFTPELYGCDYGSLDAFLAGPNCGSLTKY